MLLLGAKGLSLRTIRGHFGLSAYRILMCFFFVPKYLFRCGKLKNENYFVEKLFINT